MSFDDLTGGGDDSFSWDDSGDDSSDGGADDSGSTGSGGSGSTSSDSDGSSYTSGGSAESGLLWRLKGDALFHQGLYNESAEAYGKALEYDPYALKSWTGMGKVLLELGRPAKAAEAFTKATRLDPADAALYEMLGDAWAANGTFDDAIVNYQKALAMNPRITGVAEKILLTEQAQAATMVAPVPAEEVLPTAEISGPDPTETIPLTAQGTDVVQVPVSTQASFPGLLAGFTALVLGYIFMGTKKT
jgi:tetratricopeptide (TPR) repeat protein